ncbi:MAG: outer membrane protein assembly factor BamC [Thiomicrorhabdus sp.]|nr:outer membrane protein assembly factor BamC [Thiomicrorhabdus sp.]
MHLSKRIFFISASVATLGLSGCSMFQNSENTYQSNYRDSETEIVQTLEMPPNLFNPGQAKSQLAETLAQLELDKKPEQGEHDYIPTFHAEGLAIKSNLSERWLEIESVESEQVWQNVKQFLQNFGFTIAEERKDIGVLRTEYLKRTELVPQDDIGLITKLLNSWRPELAEGVFDKFVVRVETDADAARTRVYFSHHMLYSPEVNASVEGSERWKIKPYRPEMEAQALYQAMVFFGSSRDKALEQLQVSEQMVELVEGEEFSHLVLRASVDKGWSYLQAMIYRADWKVNQTDSAHYSLWVEVPENIKQEKSILSSLAFWRSSEQQDLPSVVKLQLSVSDEDTKKTLLTVQSADDATPLNGSQRRYIFEHLGLLAH